ncbi:MAG: DNA-formamidopyrimidine glycosylase family protein [Tunicatimonas sp.]
MPELPEVATYQKFFEQTALHRRVTSVAVLEPRVVLLSPELLTERLVGQTFERTQRIGKQLFVALSGDAWLTLHFGMTGSLRYYRDSEDTPRFAKVVWGLDDGFFVAFCCPRILGRVGVVDDLEAFRRKKKLGEDAQRISQEEFSQRLAGRKGLIKPLLLNQSLVAGLGNWIVDEVLYQAKVHPMTPANMLSEKDVTTIYEKIQHVLATAIRHEARYEDFPRDFLVTYRWLERDGHPLQQKNIERIVVGGRSTYYCPEEQVLA